MPNRIATAEPRSNSGDPPTVVETEERIRESYADYLTDESGYGPAACERLVFAHDERQVADVLTDAGESGSEVTVSAGRTGIVGGAVPQAGILLSLAEMKRILGIARLPDGRLVLRAEPGITIAELAERLETKDLGLDPDELTGEEAGALESFLEGGRAYFYPPDPTEDTAHLGATVATNASGARSFRYGATRMHVQGLRACLPCGGVLDVDREACRADGGVLAIEGPQGTIDLVVPSYALPSTKNAAGLFAAPDADLVDLFVGSEGTLGVITEVRIALAPKPEGILSALAFFGSDADALSFVRHARGDPGGESPPEAVRPMALEFFDSRSFDFLRERKNQQGPSSGIPELPEDARAGVLFEQDYVEDSLLSIYEGWETLLVDHGSSMEQTWGGMEEGDLARLRALRHSIAEEVNKTIAAAKIDHPSIHKIGTDAAVPNDALETMFGFYREELDGTDLRHVIFGHIGDSHLHLNIMPRDLEELRVGMELAMAAAERAVSLGGTVSAEHGIGKLKHEFLRMMYGDEGLAEMAAVKRALDPKGLLNRGVMFSEDLL